ncbi:MAG: DUF2807 domain-containing protein [Gemmatimonadetes bacterium]|nr:DUF2807 domain-containing protein [Gemmatimonadota bacterium]
MKKHLIVAWGLTVPLLLSGCIALTDPLIPGGGGTVIGSGRVITVSRSVSGFSTIRVNGVARVTIEQTGEETLSITADDNIVPVLHSDVEDGTLILGTRDDTNIESSTEIFYRLTVKDLRGIDINGVITADAAGLDTDRLDINLNGVSTLTTEGRADRQFINLNGVSAYRADKLHSLEARVEADGVLTVVLRVSDRLDVLACGAGSVEYIGDPLVDLHDTCAAVTVRKL